MLQVQGRSGVDYFKTEIRNLYRENSKLESELSQIRRSLVEFSMFKCDIQNENKILRQTLSELLNENGLVTRLVAQLDDQIKTFKKEISALRLSHEGLELKVKRLGSSIGLRDDNVDLGNYNSSPSPRNIPSSLSSREIIEPKKEPIKKPINERMQELKRQLNVTFGDNKGPKEEPAVENTENVRIATEIDGPKFHRLSPSLPQRHSFIGDNILIRKSLPVSPPAINHAELVEKNIFEIKNLLNQLTPSKSAPNKVLTRDNLERLSPSLFKSDSKLRTTPLPINQSEEFRSSELVTNVHTTENVKSEEDPLRSTISDSEKKHPLDLIIKNIEVQKQSLAIPADKENIYKKDENLELRSYLDTHIKEDIQIKENPPTQENHDIVNFDSYPQRNSQPKMTLVLDRIKREALEQNEQLINLIDRGDDTSSQKESLTRSETGRSDGILFDFTSETIESLSKSWSPPNFNHYSKMGSLQEDSKSERPRREPASASKEGKSTKKIVFTKRNANSASKSENNQQYISVNGNQE